MPGLFEEINGFEYGWCLVGLGVVS